MNLDAGSRWGKRLLNEKAKNVGEAPLNNYIVQAAVARYAYEHRPADEIESEPFPERITGNVIMSWWADKDLNTTYGNYADDHPDYKVNPNDETQIARIVEELRGNETLH